MSDIENALARLVDDGGRDIEEAVLNRPLVSEETETAAEMKLPTETEAGMNLTPQDKERLDAEVFVRTHADPRYRERISYLHACFHAGNVQFFGAQLPIPHIDIGPLAARLLCQFRDLTNNGGELDITLSERAAFGSRSAKVTIGDWSEPGVRRLAEDLLIRAMANMRVALQGGADDDEAFETRLAREMTRLSPHIGLPEGVVVRARRRGERDIPTTANWPEGFRPAGYYEPGVRFHGLRMRGQYAPACVPPSLLGGFCEYLLYLTNSGQTVRLTEVLGRYIDAAKVARQPALAAAERNPMDPSGMPLPMPSFDPDWMLWNGGCVRAIAEGILQRRMFEGMPILADALQDSGCEHPVILSHARACRDHTASCWLLKGLAMPSNDPEEAT